MGEKASQHAVCVNCKLVQPITEMFRDKNSEEFACVDADACRIRQGIFCRSCGYAHTDPRLRDSDSEVSIDFAGQRLVCETYARWIAEAILDGRDVHLMRLGNAMEVVKIEGARPVPDPNRLQMLPSGHTYYRGIAHYCQEPDCPARKV